MSKYKYSRNSLRKLGTSDKRLQMLAAYAIEITPIDFGVSCGERTLEDQMKAFKAGYSKCDGIIHKSKHNYSPSLAIDIYCYVDGRANYVFDNLHLVIDCFRKASEVLNIPCKFGIDWKRFPDGPHIELI